MRFMGRIPWLILFVLGAPFARSETDHFFIQAVDPSLDLSPLKGKHVKILPPPGHGPAGRSLPPKAVRERVFQESGMTSSIEGLDEFDRDSLYIRLRDESDGEKIAKKYPRLEKMASELKRARLLIEAEEKKQ